MKQVCLCTLRTPANHTLRILLTKLATIASVKIYFLIRALVVFFMMNEFGKYFLIFTLFMRTIIGLNTRNLYIQCDMYNACFTDFSTLVLFLDASW